MTSRDTTSRRPRRLLYAALASLAMPTLPTMAAEDTTAAANAIAPDQKAALDALDLLIAGFEALLGKVTDADHKAVTEVFLDSVKERRDALGKSFDQSDYRDLRLDINHEYQRLALWMAPLKTPPRAATTAGVADASPNAAQAGKKALDALAWQIGSLESRAGRSESKRRVVEAIREHHNALRQTFTKAGYDALLVEMSAFGQERRVETGKSVAPPSKAP